MTIVILLSISAHAGTWTRLNSQTLTFSGSIAADEFERFQEKYSADVRTLHVKSTGGVAIVGLQIGEVLAQNPDLTVIVDDYCMSSCANYLFTAAKNKLIRDALVGMHGNITTIVNSEEQADFMRRLAEEDPEKHQQETQSQQQYLQRERRFLQSLGIRQELFDKSAEMTSSAEYQMYIPDRQIMDDHGIKNITGEQAVPDSLRGSNLRLYFDRHSDN